MHSAPAVVFPVGRSRFAGALVLLLWLAGVAAISVWVFQPGEFGWRQALALFSIALTGLLALQDWLASPAGDLSWTGQHWVWSSKGRQFRGLVVPHLDIQHCLLLRFHGAQQGASRWVWLERQASAGRWGDLRCAVYSRARIVASDASGP